MLLTRCFITNRASENLELFVTSGRKGSVVLDNLGGMALSNRGFTKIKRGHVIAPTKDEIEAMELNLGYNVTADLYVRGGGNSH